MSETLHLIVVSTSCWRGRSWPTKKAFGASSGPSAPTSRKGNVKVNT